ncbi:MAG: GlsB/YeaQ/YmgE family stress response membrane protein [Clostridia bacterium]|nr:GlsB/YeaQ/YmgE family stress response membrane protein [Clostridia bacterium]
MFGFVITLFVAALAGWIGDALVRNNMPGGFWGALLAGLVGSWIGAYIPVFNTLGPRVLGVALIPTIIGAAVFVFILGLFKSAVKQAS